MFKRSKRTKPCQQYFGSFGWLSPKEAAKAFNQTVEKYFEENKLKYATMAQWEAYENNFRFRTKTKQPTKDSCQNPNPATKPCETQDTPTVKSSESIAEQSATQSLPSSLG